MRISRNVKLKISYGLIGVTPYGGYDLIGILPMLPNVTPVLPYQSSWKWKVKVCWWMILTLLKCDSPTLSSHYVTPIDNVFLDCFDSLGLTQWVCELTYPRSSNILGLFFTTDPDRVGQIQVPTPLPKCGCCPVLTDFILSFKAILQPILLRVLKYVVQPATGREGSIGPCQGS